MSKRAVRLPHKRSMALAAGVKLYRTGKACRAGHYGPRYAKSGDCVQCAKDRAAAQYEATKQGDPKGEAREEDVAGADESETVTEPVGTDTRTLGEPSWKDLPDDDRGWTRGGFR